MPTSQQVPDPIYNKCTVHRISTLCKIDYAGTRTSTVLLNLAIAYATLIAATASLTHNPINNQGVNHVYL